MSSRWKNALNISRQLYLDDSSDEWTQKALAWVLIDLCKHYIADNNLNQAGTCYRELITIDFQGYEDDIIENQSLLICAPPKDMDLKGLHKIGAIFTSLVTVTVPDPVVLHPCKGGYLIIAAWGDEASDEIVVNNINN